MTNLSYSPRNVLQIGLLAFLASMLHIASGAQAETRADTARTSPRIFYGRNTLPGEGPWAVRLMIEAETGMVYSCGGSFIDPIVDGGRVVGWKTDSTKPRWILTAAHCIEVDGKIVQPNSVIAISGTLDLSKSESEGETQRAISIIRHHDFSNVTLENDIALIVLESSRKEIPDYRRRSIRMPELWDINWVNERYLALYAQGWGKRENGTDSLLLQEALLPLVDHSDCQSKFQQFGQKIFSGMLCAGFAAAGFDSCQGDSGGPLVYRPLGNLAASQRSGTAVLIGTVSWGLGCGTPDLFGVYTSSAFYVTWVKEQIDRCLRQNALDKCS